MELAAGGLVVSGASVLTTSANAGEAVPYVERSWNESRKTVDSNWKSTTDYTLVNSGVASWCDIGP